MCALAKRLAARASLLAAAAGMAGTLAVAELSEEVREGPSPHKEEPDYQPGISLLHPLKYGADFQHFEFANPDAPKGGPNVS